MAKTRRFSSLREYVDAQPGVTQKEIAQQLGLSGSALSLYMRGLVPSARVALRLHEEFGIDLKGLLTPSRVA